MNIYKTSNQQSYIMRSSGISSRLSMVTMVCFGVLILDAINLLPIGRAQAAWANGEIPIASSNRYYPTTMQQLFAADLENSRAPEMRDLMLAKSNLLFNNGGSYSHQTRNSDDHLNIDLDKLGQLYPYDTVLAQPDGDMEEVRAERPVSLNNLFHKLNQLAREYARDQVEKKRTSRSLVPIEDKDYTFVISSMTDKNNNEASWANSNNQAAKWSNHREKVQPSGPKYRLFNELNVAAHANTNPDQLSKLNRGTQYGVTIAPVVSPTAVQIPKYREKRRRCKVDPNLGVKNPSYCDTEGYFGAADYSMRDVWDSAGR